MSRDNHYRLAITPLSPVHMGTDADYEPTGYVIDDGALFEFDGIAALTALPGVERRKLDQILGGKPSDRVLREVQGFFHANRESLIACSRRQVRVNATIEAFYRDRVGKVAQHEHGGGNAQNRLEIQRTAWNPVSGQPILPGSGLKGAIRTALLDRENDGRRLQDRQERNRDLQTRLFQGSFATDPMRLVRVGDAPLGESVELPTEVWFALNRKKRPVEKHGTLVQSQAEQKGGPPQLLECLPPLHPRAFAGSLTIQDLGRVGNDRNTPRLRFSIDDIGAACNRFYRPILDHELQLLRQRGYVDSEWSQQIVRLLDALQQDFDTGHAFLLRTGRHSGAESVTLNGVRSIRIMKRKGERSESLDAAKTLWLAGHERQAQRGLLPFGWLLVEIDPDGADDPWQGFEPPAEDRAWLQRVQERVGTLRHAAERERAKREAEQRRKAEAEAVRQAAEEAERHRAEVEAARKQAEFDALPEFAKRLRRFEDELGRITASPPLKQERFSEVMGTINRLKDDAQSWSAAERGQAADAIEAAFERFGWTPSGLKADKRRKQEAKRRKLVAGLRGTK